MIVALLAPQLALSAERYKDRGDGTVLDTKTNLVWMKDAGLHSVPVQVAISLIRDINVGKLENHGYNDWRIPSFDEILSLIDTSEAYPALSDGHPFDNVQLAKYWSSTGGFDMAGYAWVVDMASGVRRFELTSYCNFYNVWPVRSTGTVTIAKFEPEGLPVRPEDVAFLSMQRQGEVCRDESSGTPPDLPADILVTAVSPSEMVVSWSGDSATSAWFNVYDGDTFVQSTPTKALRIKGLKPGTRRCFTVSAYSAKGYESLKSKEACTRTWITKAAGTVWSSGLNSYGQLGDGTHTDSNMLVQAKGLEGVTSVAAGVEHTAAVGKDGSLWLWGRNSRGQLGDGTTTGHAEPVLIEALKTVKQIALGWYHSLALLNDGSVHSWGRNYYGQLGDGTRADNSSAVNVSILDNVIQVASGWYHSIALKRDGTVWAWGWDIKGQLGNGDDSDAETPELVVGVDGIKQVAGGMYHTLALNKDGAVWAWGSNEFGQSGQPPAFQESQAPLIVDGLKNITSVDGGMNFSIALDSDGSVWAWGRNDYGQLGHDDITQSFTPLKVPGLADIKTIAAGAHHAVAVDSDGSLWLWGWDYANSLKFAPPYKVGGLTGITKVAAGVHFITVLKGH